MISSLEAIFCEKFAESTEKIRKIAKQECPEAPKGWQIWQMWVTGPSNPTAMVRAGAMGKTPPYLPGQSPPADTGQIPCGSEKTLPLEAQIRGRFRSGEGKGINPLPRDWEGRDLFMNLVLSIYTP